MSSLSEIESKIAALRARYDELDKRLVPKRNGVVDGSVSAAMGAITAELARLERLREKALTADLIGETSMKSPSSLPPPQRSTAPLPEPVFATKNADLIDPLLDIERLPSRCTMTTLASAEDRLRRELLRRSARGQSSCVANVDFVLCEDFESVMIYVDTTDELDAAYACFDLPDGMPFDPERLREQITLRSEWLH